MIHGPSYDLFEQVLSVYYRPRAIVRDNTSSQLILRRY